MSDETAHDGILIASLGESPTVIPVMYDLLVQRKKLSFERIVVLCPEGEDIQKAYKRVRNALAAERVLLVVEQLGFEDANSKSDSRKFLRGLYKLLESYQQQERDVYLSLAGGRKNMAALMAWVAPFFPCVKGLYHVVDKDREDFPTLYDIIGMSSDEQEQAIRPKNNSSLWLVDIPYKRGAQIGARHEKILSNLPDDIDLAESVAGKEAIWQETPPFEILVTQQVKQQLQKLIRENVEEAQEIYKGLLGMYQWVMLPDWVEKEKTYPFRSKTEKFPQVLLRFPAGFPSDTDVRPVFYTTPISLERKGPVRELVIYSLENKGSNGYRTLQEVAYTSGFSLKSKGEIPPVPSPATSVLVVPLGTSPMVATQLYTLLKEQKHRRIHEIVLVYPEQSTAIDNAVKLVINALQEEAAEVRCIAAFVPDLEDIVTEDDCLRYQRCVEDEITRIQATYPNSKIDLALSGGRKGMTAMTMFAAQEKHIPYVFHTLIKDEAVNKLIEEQTSVDALNDISTKERNDRLFLRKPAYRTEEDDDPYANFALFEVPLL